MPRAGEEGTQVLVTPLSWALLSGQLGSSPTAPSPPPAAPKLFPDCSPSQTGPPSTNRAAGTSVIGLQRQEPEQSHCKVYLRPNEGSNRPCVQAPYQSGKEETHEKRSKEESKVLGSSPVPGAMDRGPGEQGRLSGSLPWAGSPA